MVFKLGQSGNIKGRPKGTKNAKKYLGKAFKDAIEEMRPEALHQLYKKVKQGNLNALELVLAYDQGKPLQKIAQQNFNLFYSSWTDEQIESFSESGEMPKLNES